MHHGKLDSIASRLLFGFAAGVAAYVLVVNLIVITLPAPQEYRESAILLTTDSLLRGVNPYALENQPVCTNVYGIAYHLVVYPFARLVGGATFIVHRSVSTAFVLLTCTMLYRAARWSGATRTLAFAGATLLYCDLASRCANLSMPALPLSITARPDSMGMALFLASVLVPWRRKFDNRGLIAAGVLGIAAFYTKPYFVLGAFIVAAYVFLFRSKQRGFVLGVGCLVALAATLTLATWLMPCYFAEIIIANYSTGRDTSASHLYAQLRFYLASMPGTIGLLIVLGGIGLAALVRRRRDQQPNSVESSALHFFAFCLAVGFAAIFFKFGRYGGNSMIYIYQLVSPFLLLTLLAAVAAMRKQADGAASRGWIAMLPFAIDLLITIATFPPVPRAHADVWAEWRGIIAQHDVYAPPPLAWIQMEQRKPIYDAGQSELFLHCLDGSIYPSEQAMRARYDAFAAELARRVEQRRFGRIVLPYDGKDKPQFTLLPNDALQRHYRPVGRLEMPMDWQPGWYGVVLEPLPLDSPSPTTATMPTTTAPTEPAADITPQ
jgi:hypothetical protein